MTKKYCEHCGQQLEGKKKTYVHFILDNSGSMSSVKAATISGFNEYIEKLKNDGNEYEFEMTMFASGVTRFSGKDIKNVKPLTDETYTADGGSTALYDAVCSTINAAYSGDEGHSKHLVVILTDGQENASISYTRADLNKHIKRRESQGNWTFVFLGANQDSWANAQQYGINHIANVSSFAFNDNGIRSAFMATARATSDLSASAKTTTDSFFSAEDKINMS
jgi:hypothetical protein